MENNIAVLASTKATDMQAIIDAIQAGRLNANLKLVISNKKDSFSLERARKYDIKSAFIDPKDKSKEEYDRLISDMLEENNIRLILLIGYMKLMSSWFVSKYKNKVMNIHPSLLPAFAGDMDLNVHRAVLERGCKLTGASLIFINEGPDTGPIIMQKAVEVNEDDGEESLKIKVQEAEQELLLEAIPLYLAGKIVVTGKKVNIK